MPSLSQQCAIKQQSHLRHPYENQNSGSDSFAVQGGGLWPVLAVERNKYLLPVNGHIINNELTI